MRHGRRISFLAGACLLLFFVLPARAGQVEPLGTVPLPADNPQTAEKIELGRKLFFDRRLSGDGTMSCATCHIPDLAFTDGLDISLSYPTTKSWRNTPTLMNIGFATRLFHDGRSPSLEDQALFPVMSSFEMNQNLDYLEEELREVPEYVESFRRIFGGDIDRQKMAMALAAFQRTLVSKNAPIDRYLAGDEKALSEGARRGLEIFSGKGGCTQCHHGPALSDFGFHTLNVPENPRLEKDPRIAITVRFVAKVSGYEDYKNLHEDPGRFLVTKEKKDWKAFRTPTLREISKTGPYMHNGVFDTLEEVIDFYNGGAGPGNRAGLGPLGLSAGEKHALKTFLVEALMGDDLVIPLPEIP
jgi:cytochrome c peroxidase